MTDANKPLSEIYRVAAREWVDLDAAARLLEESKSAVLSQKMKALGDLPAAHAERDVKAGLEWLSYLKSMVSARTKANEAKVKLEWLRMRFATQQSEEASRRAEMRL